jgi:hypothetical protein
LTKIAEPFVMMPHALFDSDEYRTLSPIERDILWLLIRRHNGHNNGTVPLGDREAGQWCHCSHVTAWRALKALQLSGLVTLTEKGRIVLNGSGIRRASLWRLNFLKGGGPLSELAAPRFTHET